MDISSDPQKKWLPIECNPDVFNMLIEKLGFPVSKLKFTDVFALDEEIWKSMMPHPIAAVILAFPIKEVHSDMRKQIIENFDSADEKNVCFMKQRVKNACGTMAILHTALNVFEHLGDTGFAEGSFLEKFQKWDKGKFAQKS